MRYLTGLAVLGLLSGCVSPTVPDSGAAAPAPTGEPLSALIEGSSVSAQPIDAPASISDEQDFSVVSERESIESDAERLAGYQAAYTQVEPEAVPERPRGSSVSIVQFALSTSNSVGEAIYQRSSLSGQARADRNCSRYTSADFAQIAFLEAGGPRRDRYGIDPDGDGFACDWNPAPFRAARGDAVEAPVVEDTGVSAADLQAAGIVADPQPVPLPVLPVPLPGDALNISTE